MNTRATDLKLRTLADSALLKVLQYIVTAVALPLVAWGGSTILDRLTKIEDALNRAATVSATFELRVQALERTGVEREAAIKLLTERSIEHDYGIRRLEELTNNQRSKK